MARAEILLTPSEATRLVSLEVRQLQHRLELLERGVEHVYEERGGRLGRVAMTALQELDMLAQCTDAIAAYIEKLAIRLNNDAPLDLAAELSAIPLRALEQRLSGSVQDELCANAPELF